MTEYKFNLNNFKKQYEKFSYSFFKIVLLGIVLNFVFLYLFYKTKDDTYLLLFLILLCGGLVSLIITLSHIDNLKRKNKDSVLKIDYNKNFINEYKVLKLINYNITSKNIQLYGYFENDILDNLFNYQKYVSYINIPRQYENENDIINKLDIIKNNIYEVDKCKFIHAKIDFIPLLIISFLLIFTAFVGIFIDNKVLMVLSFILSFISLGIIAFLSIEHKDDLILFKDDCIEYENSYIRDEVEHTKYVNKYKIYNIAKIKKNKFLLIIYGDIEKNVFHISKYKEENMNNSKIIETTKLKKIFIFNLYKDQERLSKYINEYK